MRTFVGTLTPDVRERDTLCDRCGMKMVRVRRKVNGLTLCNGCKHDRWYITAAGGRP